jgi:hypothetical protein
VRTRRKQALAIIAGGVAALVLAIHFATRGPDPPTRTSLKPVQALVAPTDNSVQAPVVANPARPSGDSFRELRQCVYASRELIIARSQADCSFYEGKPQYQQTLAECLNGWMNTPNRIAAAEAALKQCDEADMGTRYFEATKEAAQRGNVDAQLCYLQGDFFSPEGAQIFNDAEIEEYKKVAPRYVDAAVKRGDWRIVHLLNKRNFHPGVGPVALLEGIGDRDTQYRMTKLLRLGASGTYARLLDGQLHDMKHPDLNPSAALRPQVIKEGDAWAQETFTNYFSGVTGLTQDPLVCSPEPGRPGSLSDLPRLPGAPE